MRRHSKAGTLHREIIFDYTTNKTDARTTQDVAPFFRRNAELRAVGGDGYSASHELRQVASIPPIIVEQWLREGFNLLGKFDQRELRKRLNDLSNLNLRTNSSRM